MTDESKSATPVVGTQQWVESFPEGLYDLAREITFQDVEQVERVDASNRRLIWDDGQSLSFDESVQRICAAHPEMPVDLIHSHLVGWLEMEELPGDLSMEEMDALEEQIMAWTEELNGAE